MDLIKNAAQTHQLDSTGQREFKSTYLSPFYYIVFDSMFYSSCEFVFLVILLTEVDKLTKDAQQALRRTMEKYIATCRLILCANSISQVIPAIRSRCLSVRVPSPSQEEIVTILLV